MTTTLEAVGCILGCEADDDVPVVTAGDRELGLPGEFTVVRCGRCGLLRTDPRPDPESMGAFYPADYAPYRLDTDGSRSRGHRWVRRVFRFRHHALPPIEPGRALEFGCGSGDYLVELRAAGWHVTGIELSDDAAARARSRGLEVRTGRIEDVDLPVGVDLAVAWMALEHVHDPIGVLRRLRGAVREDGWLSLSVPNAASVERRLFGPNWYALALPRHLFHFTPATITAVLAEAGWTVERVQHQRLVTSFVASIGRALETQAGSIGRLGVWLASRPSRSRLLPALSYPVAVVLAAFGQTGRMTVWARPAGHP